MHKVQLHRILTTSPCEHPFTMVGIIIYFYLLLIKWYWCYMEISNLNSHVNAISYRDEEQNEKEVVRQSTFLKN